MSWKPLRKLLAERLPGCKVALIKRRVLRVVVPWADSPKVIMHLTESRYDARTGRWWLCSPASIEQHASHVFITAFKNTYDRDKWPPARIQAMLRGPFDVFFCGMARHFADVLEQDAVSLRAQAERHTRHTKLEVRRGALGVEAETLAEQAWLSARANEFSAQAAAYRAVC